MHVGSKLNLRDQVGPLEDSAGNIIARVFNGGIRKWLPVSDAKFQEAKLDYLGQLW